jgi:hypothetical protein
VRATRSCTIAMQADPMTRRGRHSSGRRDHGRRGIDDAEVDRGWRRVTP